MGQHRLSVQPIPIVSASNFVAQTHPTRIIPLTHPFSLLPTALLCLAMGHALQLQGCSSVTGGVDVALTGAGCPRVPVCSRSCRVHTSMHAGNQCTLWQEGLRAERHVSHLHYTAWPDHGIPESTSSILAFRELVREHIQSAKDAGPTLVHCRQGAARWDNRWERAQGGKQHPRGTESLWSLLPWDLGAAHPQHDIQSQGMGNWGCSALSHAGAGAPWRSVGMMYPAAGGELLSHRVRQCFSCALCALSAGVGRSGTFIALDRLLQQMKQEKVVDMFGVVYTLRMNRYQMIQTLVRPLLPLPLGQKPVGLADRCPRVHSNSTRAFAGSSRPHQVAGLWCPLPDDEPTPPSWVKESVLPFMT